MVNAQPDVLMRTSIASIALIRRDQNGQTEWLAQWNRNWRAYAFIGGHKRPHESFRACIIREIGEELGLIGSEEFAVGHEPLARQEYQAWSQSAQEQTEYTIELFEVKLVGEAASTKIDAEPHNRWLTEQEIRTGCCRDGKPVTETVARFLDAIGTRP
jgi:8-oxo-dGTP pyrophosphatase MutT (NUDIX family)